MYVVMTFDYSELKRQIRANHTTMTKLEDETSIPIKSRIQDGKSFSTRDILVLAERLHISVHSEEFINTFFTVKKTHECTRWEEALLEGLSDIDEIDIDFSESVLHG